MMKKYFLHVAVILFSTNTMAADMHDNKNMEESGKMGQGMMGSQYSSQVMSAQMMSRVTMREMSRMMEQMNNMMQDMARVMNQQQPMDQARRKDMAGIMEHMSDGLREMAKQTNKGTMDNEEKENLQKMVTEMSQMMDQMQAKMLPE